MKVTATAIFESIFNRFSRMRIDLELKAYVRKDATVEVVKHSYNWHKLEVLGYLKEG